MNTNFSFPLAGGLFACLLLLAVVHSWVSRINQFFFFSRTAPQGFSATAEARGIVRTYLTRVWLGFGAAGICYAALLLFSPLSALGCCLGAMMVQGVLCSVAFGMAHREAGSALARTSDAAEQSGEMSSTTVAVALRDSGTFTPRMQMLLFLAPLAAAISFIAPMLSARLGFNAFTEAIAARHAEFLTGLGAGLLAGSLILFVQLRYFSRHRSPLARFTANGAVQLAWIGVACLAFSTLTVPLGLDVTRQVRGMLLGIVILIALARVAYGWTRARMFTPPAVERGGDQFWRWGLFYYNPSDPALLIQHRSGPGYTLNFARGFAWVVPALLLADVVFVALVHLRH